jgi:hypothetical protein
MKDTIWGVKTKSGLPAVTERGGGMTNTGDGRVWADNKGRPMKPIFIFSRGHLACGEHALFVAKKGMYTVYANRHRQEVEVTISKIVDIKPAEDDYNGEGFDIELEEIAVVNFDGHSNQVGKYPAFLEDAVKAAIEKSRCYHCRCPHFISANK